MPDENTEQTKKIVLTAEMIAGELADQIFQDTKHWCPICRSQRTCPRHQVRH